MSALRDRLKEKLRDVKLPIEKLEVPEWGETVWVRTVTAEERDAFEAASVKGKGKNREANLHNIRARMAALTLCDEAGQPLFTPADAAFLGTQSAKVLGCIYDVATRLNGWSDEDVEELAKN